MKPQKRGLVLEGGASRGAYLIGAYRALVEAGLSFDGVVGTSVGAINGAMIVQGLWKEAWQLWSELTFEDIFRGNEALMEYVMLEPITWQSLPVRIKAGIGMGVSKGMDITPLIRLIHHWISEDAMRSAETEFGLTTINLTKRRIERPFVPDMPEGSLHDYILASAYMPIFQRHKLMGCDYLDGCFYDNLPWSMLANKGYTHLTMLRIPGNGRVIKPYPKDVEILEITPSEPLPSMLGFHNSLTRHMLQLGYLDAKRALGETQGHLYYIDAASLSSDEISLLPTMEAVANELGISRYQIFSWEDFLFRIYQDSGFQHMRGLTAEKTAIYRRLHIEISDLTE